MKVVLVTLLLAAAVFAEEQYDSSGDDVDLSQLLRNERLLTAYSKCLISKGPCTPEIKKVKDKLPEALATRCAKCTPRQKSMAKQLAHELQKTHPDLWKQLVAHYDPSGKYQQAFQEILA